MLPDARSTVRFASFIVFLDLAGVGLITPVMPRLITEIAGTDIGRAAEIGGYLYLAFATMQFLFSPIIGSLSDRFGRRPVLLLTLASFAIDYGVMAVAPTLWMLAIGRMVSGITGATWAAACSSVSDVIPQAERGAAFGAVGGAGAAGLVLGPVIGGLAGGYNVRLPFAIAAALAAGGALVGLYRFAETLPKEVRRSFSLARANPIGSLLQASRSPFVLGCLAVLFLIQLALQAQMAIWPYYGMAKFGWSPLTIGLTTALYGVMMVLVRALATKRAIARYGAATTARLAILFSIPSYLMIAFAGTMWVVIVAIVFGSIAGMTFPAVQAMMTAQVSADGQGELQGQIASTAALTAIVGPVLMTQIFEHYAGRHGLFMPGAPFLLAAMLLVAAAGLLWTLATGPQHKHRC